MPFVAGKSGNPLGRPPEKYSIRSILKRIGNQIVTTSVGPMRKAELMWTAVYNEAIKGDVRAAVAIADRLEGKPEQKIFTTDIDLVEQNRILLAQIGTSMTYRDSMQITEGEYTENESATGAEIPETGESVEDSNPVPE